MITCGFEPSLPEDAQQSNTGGPRSGPSPGQSAREILHRPLAGLLALAIALAGCAMVGPDYVKPTAPEPREWIEKEDPKIKSEPADFSTWWKVFEDPVLDTLIEKAYKQNLPLRMAGIRILEARAQLGIAVGRQFPQWQRAEGGYAYRSRSENTAGTLPGMDFDFGEINLGFDAAWEIDVWGRYRRAVESSIGNLEASIANYDDVLVSLTAEVARTYVLVRTFEARLAVARENVKIQKRSLQIAEARFEGGEVSELDVQQAKALLRETQALIPGLDINLRQAKNGLAILLGILPDQIEEIVGGPMPIPTPPVEVAVGIPADLLRRRPDIRLAERRVASQCALIGVAKADLYPHFVLFGSIGLRASDAAVTAAGFPGGSSFGDFFNSNSIEWFTGPAFSWSIFNYGRIKNRVRLQDARFQRLAVNYQNTVLRAAQEVEDAMVAFLRAQQEAGYLLGSVEASKRSVDLSMLQYREGLADYQRVLEAQRSLRVAQDRLAATTGSVAVNLVSMYKALGGGWEIRVGRDFVPERVREEMRERTNWGRLLAPEKAKLPAPEEKPKEWRRLAW
ncbi:MAG: efflux transporter outer membrane subunit [Deltaproteobacteria bacterium]|nr:efflux transporter outer membrane subunit [Deltaproteobacteria bacterium]